LQDAPKATVAATLRPTAGSERDAAFCAVVENTSKNLAFLTRLRLVKGNEQTEILPVFWEDNYTSLLPGEKREVLVRVRKTDLKDAHPALLVDGFNVTTKTVHLSE